MGHNVADSPVLGMRPFWVLPLVPWRAAWLACTYPFGRMEWKLRAQALESDSPRSELQNGHWLNCDMGHFAHDTNWMKLEDILLNENKSVTDKQCVILLLRHSCTCVLSCFSHVQLFVTLWTTACQVPLSMGFSRQENWSGLLCPPPGESSRPRDWIPVSYVFCIDRWLLYH